MAAADLGDLLLRTGEAWPPAVAPPAPYLLTRVDLTRHSTGSVALRWPVREGNLSRLAARFVFRNDRSYLGQVSCLYLLLRKNVRAVRYGVVVALPRGGHLGVIQRGWGTLTNSAPRAKCHMG